ncbi:ABC transporter permease [Chitinophaga ginsengisegetis]|uniref:ABC transporter permease n=1 Tax=Chitinophaga ginsengisegetis TaxID=393003 RepID=UPI000DB980E0|nr:ABC transporter permease [Chitinophaga ginsengisegetis]MDR6569282.1 putative ABC transport system permease protein [Chitinophaga ginsengisegetis]MDR6648687.1 putative ABC transport system permease protein [Chitinophaga ginsengisegetis]MDR6655365.1 putative ABC transport system permease protein [Chitinophaga ginsengisegetis]
MFRNHLLIAWRNLVRFKYYSLINIAGLSIGLAACWLLLLYVHRETSYDNFYPQADRIYRAVNHATWTGGNLHLASTSAPFAAVLKKDYPEIEQITRVEADGGAALKYGEKKLEVGDMFFVDSTFFDVFNFPMAAGDAVSALAQPNSLVLTRSLAQKLIGSPEEAIGKTILTDDSTAYTVSAVMEDVPSNSHFSFSALRLLPPDYNANGWQNFDVYTYLLLQKDADAKALESKLPAFFERYLKPRMGEVTYKMELQPVRDIHLHSHLDYEISPNGNILYIYVFLCIGLLTLLIACINYMNLATARASARIKEVGVRKSMGSGREEIARLFLTESMLLTFLAALVAMGLVAILLPWFNTFTGSQVQLWQFGLVKTIVVIVMLALLTGLFAGIYPAVFMSGFKVINSLKGKLGNSGHAGFRKGLVTFQFIVAIILTGSTMVAYDQLQYMMHKNLGFDKDQVLSFHIPDQQMRSKMPVLKDQLLRNPLVQHVAAASNPIGRNNIGGHGFFFEQNGSISDASVVAQNYMVDADYLKTMGITLQSGRNFSDTGESDMHHSVLINETLVKMLNWDQPLGKRVQFKIDQEGHRAERVVIGVMKDFHIYSLQHKIAPLVLEMPPFPGVQDNVYVKVSKSNVPAAVAYIEKVFHSFDPAHQFDYSFIDQNFARQYAGEQKQETIFMLFAVLALFIACLGLFGLAAFTAVQRTKEIGVRKTLGASTGNIVKLLSKDFLQLLLIAAAVAFPVTWWIMDRWLNNFAYHAGISIWVFVLTGSAVVVIALATVSFHAVKAALANPVKSLRAD